MSRTVSFFYRQRDRAGFTEKIDVRSEGVALEVYVFSQVSLVSDHSDLLKEKSFESGKDYKNFHNRLRDAVRDKGGGLIATVTSTDRETVVEIVNLIKEGKTPDEYLLLAPGYMASFQKLQLTNDKAQILLRPGSHIALPADGEAQRHLHQLHENLGWLSPDAETLVLNTIWRASLAQRVGKLEEYFVGQATAPARPANWLGKIRDLRDRLLPSWTWLLAAGLLLLLLLNLALVAQMQLFMSKESTEVSGQGNGGDPNAPDDEDDDLGGEGEEVEHVDRPAVSFTPDDEIVKEIDRTLDLLNSNWSILGPADKRTIIYNSHVAGNPVRRTEDLDESGLFALGFVKLFLLERGRTFNEQDFSDTTWRSNTKQNLLDILPDLTGEEKQMLAFVTCQPFGLAGFPRVTKDRVQGPVDVGVKCDEIALNKALEGLKALTSKLKEPSDSEENGEQ